MAIRVLIVDDTDHVRNMLSHMLTLDGFDVVGAVGGAAEGIGALSLFEPDIVIMDLKMPIMDGIAATRAQSAWELRLSHWTGSLPALNVKLDWAYGRYHHLYGSMTYGGTGVFGFRSTRVGVPLDTFGRNLYVDTLDSAYGAGWKRENSFLTHQNGGRGTFCYGFFPHGKRPAGTGTHYRMSVIGPGVTPDVVWQGEARGPYDRAADGVANDEQRSPDYADPSCKVN